MNGDGLKHLHVLKDLRSLDLSRNPISDDDLIHLIPLKNLESLDLTYTNVTDKGLQHLKKLPKLNRLHLRIRPDSGTSREGRMELNKALPKLEITFITH